MKFAVLCPRLLKTALVPKWGSALLLMLYLDATFAFGALKEKKVYARI
jgi:hypothetical protein